MFSSSRTVPSRLFWSFSSSLCCDRAVNGILHRQKAYARPLLYTKVAVCNFHWETSLRGPKQELQTLLKTANTMYRTTTVKTGLVIRNTHNAQQICLRQYPTFNTRQPNKILTHTVRTPRAKNHQFTLTGFDCSKNL